MAVYAKAASSAGTCFVSFICAGSVCSNFALLKMDKLQSREAFSSPQACMEHRRFVDPIPIGLPRCLMSKGNLVDEQSYRLLLSLTPGEASALDNCEPEVHQLC